jgi:peptidoglycan hydrolase CwlO-like protein
LGGVDLERSRPGRGDRSTEKPNSIGAIILPEESVMASTTVAELTPEEAAELEAAIARMLAEMDELRALMERDQAEIEQLKAETKQIKAETEQIKVETRLVKERGRALQADTRSRLDALMAG